MNRARVGRLIRLTISAAIIVLLIVFARTVDWSRAWYAIIHASRPLLLAALAVNLLTLVARAVRWWILLREVGAPSLGLALRATVAGAGLNNILVANGGEAARIVFVARASGVPSARILATAALDRLLDPVGFVILLAIGVVAFDLPPELAQLRWPALVAVTVVIALVVWLTLSGRAPDAALPGESDARPEVHGWWAKTRRWLADFGNSMRELASGPRVIWILLLTLAAWITQLATFALAASAAHVRLPLAGDLAALLAVNVSLVLRATPGNVGFFQFAYALAAGAFGVRMAVAIAVSLLIQVLQIIPVTIIGVALAPEFILKPKAKAPSTA
jgi:phosphatidylinositol alpha-mannosyltransferase